MKAEKIVEKIYKKYQSPMQINRPEKLAISEAGEQCRRRLWLRFRWVIDIWEMTDGRMGRLFARGWKEEKWLSQDLTDIGFVVEQINPITKQPYFVSALEGHLKGVLDGIIKDKKKTYIVEFKTHNDKSFAKLEKEGLEKSKPEHYAQCLLYAYLFSQQYYKVKKTLYVAVNKNNDELYCEWVDNNEKKAEQILSKLEYVKDTTLLPPNFYSQNSYNCKYCEYYEFCWSDKRIMISKNCRACALSAPCHHGQWYCCYKEKIVSPAYKICKDFDPILKEQKEEKNDK